MLAATLLATAVAGTTRMQEASPPEEPVSGVLAEEVGGQRRYTNRLIHEKRPYLLQHANNPVDWFPWGQLAFDQALREGKPIFLSVGYSTCHWCYVMESESFSNPRIAALMNEHFVAIKVDREERPDIDRVYMSFVQATTGGGGWPMSVFLTADLKPFFGGTYFPPDDRDGQTGFGTLLERVHEAWATRRDEIRLSAEEVTRFLQAQVSTSAGTDAAKPDVAALERTYRQIRSDYDGERGGFGSAPKFPRPVALNFLARYYARTGDQAALAMTLHALRAMAHGGVHDHLGGGFHRYSTDAAWHVPHSEKMLYDQAQLANFSVDACQITREPFFADLARDILEYVLRDMRGVEGGFYTAENADSAAGTGGSGLTEGAFYVWTAGEIRALLGDESAALFNYHYGVEPAENVPAQQDIQGEPKGRNVLIVRHTLAETAARFRKSEDQAGAELATARNRLKANRAGRPRPSLDDKVLVAWNGLMISALARAAQVLDEPRYQAAARKAAEFIEARMFDAESGMLRRRFRKGHVDIEAVLEDYAFLIQDLLELYETTFEVKWLAWATRLQTRQDALFRDAGAGGYFATRADAAHVLVRMKDDYDGAEPSPNSVAAMNSLRLGQMTDRRELHDKADVIFLRLRKRSNREVPPSLSFLLHRTSACPNRGRSSSSENPAQPIRWRCCDSFMIASSRTGFCCSPTAPVASDSSPSGCRSSRVCVAGTDVRPPTSVKTTSASSRLRICGRWRNSWTEPGRQGRADESA